MSDFSFSTNQELIANIATVACEYDFLVIHSSFRDLRFLGGSPRDFLSLPREVSSSACVALTPCFNLDAPKPIQFFTNTTPPSLSLGTLPMYQFKRLKNNESMFRTKHSMHSYIGEGQASEKRYLAETIWKCSFGKSSFFEYLDSRKVLWLNLGCKGGVGAYSLIHHAESLSSVPYRKNLLLDSFIDGIFFKFPYYAKVVEANFDRSPLVLSKEYDKSCLLKVSSSNGSNICLHRYSDLMEICLSAIANDPFCFYPGSRALLND